MNKKQILMFFSGMLFFNIAFAQMSVDPLTGTGSVNIPIYALRNGQISVPVSLYYAASGIKPKDAEGTAGMGWQLNVGGQISRVVRGLPDDCTKDNSGAARLGWMSPADSGANKISAFTIANNSLTCSNETTDINYINANFPIMYDTEPDIFNVSAPGLSCQLVYDRVHGAFKAVNYQDLIITYTLTGGSGNDAGHISNFTITNDKGVKYKFYYGESITQKTVGGSQAYFKTRFLQYQNGITYNDSWELISVTDASGTGIGFTYAAAPPTTGTDSVALYIGGSSSYALQYRISNTTISSLLSTVQNINIAFTTSPLLSFTWTTVSGSGQSLISNIAGSGRSFLFNYTGVTYSPKSYVRSFLRSFNDYGCASPVNYQFAYQGETNSAGTYTTPLPDSSSTQRDYWGYYSTGAGTTTLVPSIYVNPYNMSYQRYLIKVSGSPGAIYAYTLANSNRAADPTVAGIGALNKITYAQGGSSNIVYEPNDYYDTPSSSVVKGAGIRVKQVIDSVGNGSTNNIIRNYTYLDPATGFSSGKPVSLPQFAYTIPYGGTATGLSLWTNATALSAYDLSPEDHTVMYAASRVSQTGAGYTTYQYYVPATYWDTGAGPGCTGCSSSEWYPTANEIGRTNCTTSSYGPVANYIYSYPFIPNPNYDFERGLPLKIAAYTDGGSEVSESTYTYNRSFSPSAITAFKYDDNPGDGLLVKSYNKYTIFCNTSELTATVTHKVFDSSLGGTSQTTTTNYTYGSSFHKLLTQQSVTNSDNSTITSYLHYTKDYTIPATGTNANINAIYYLQQQNVNVPVESFQQVTRSGTTVTTGASLTMFSPVTVGAVTHYLPSQQYKFVLPNGGSFTPMTISGSTMTTDPSYTAVPVANFDQYDITGALQTADDGHKGIATSFNEHSYNNLIAVFRNAASNEVAFSDFDTFFNLPNPNFTITGTGSASATGHTNAGYNLGSAQTLTKVISKNAIAQNYVFSFWASSTSAVNLTINLNSGTTNNAKTVTTNTTGAWTYYETRIPLTGLSTTFTAALSTSAAVTIDDVILYPDVASVSTYAYDPATHLKTAETNTNGVSAYYTFDQWGRLLYQFDQNKNIKVKNTYVTPSAVKDFAAPTITFTPAAASVTTVTPVTFTAYQGFDACSDVGLSYYWTFGDGNSITTTSATAPAHTYPTPGAYTVNVTVTSPFFGSKSASTSVTVAQAMATVTFNSYATVSSVSNINFHNSQHDYNFSSFPGSILPGTYTITITPVGGQYNPATGKGYTNFVFSDGANGQCFNYTGNNFVFSWTVLGGETLNFAIYNNNTCPFN